MIDHHFTGQPVTPEMEREATARANQAAAESERSAAFFAAHSSPPDTTRHTVDTITPAALTELYDRLERAEAAAASPRELDLRQRGAWASVGRCPMCGWDNTSGRLCTDCTATVRNLPAGKRRKWRRYEPAHTGPPVQGPGYTAAQLLGSGE